MSDAPDRYKARYLREKSARKEAEKLLEEKSRDLYQSNQELQSLAENLENKVNQRTQALQKATDEAIAHARVKSDFLANMSHELRTPMNGVLGMLNLLDDAPLNTRYRKIVKTASRSGNLLLKLINDILDFTKLENNKLELENLPFDPIELLELAVEPFIAETINSGIDLLIQIPPSIPKVLIGDCTRIQQIITNLVSNAVKFTHEGYVLVQCFHEQNTFILRVVDSGIGMSASQSNKVFSAFSQADGSTTRKYGGTGLGLSICKNLVSTMQGQLHVESQPNQGTTFTVEIPMLSEGGPRQAPVSEATTVIKCALSVPHFLEQSIIEECLVHWQIQTNCIKPSFDTIRQQLADEKIDLLIIDDYMQDNIAELKQLLLDYTGLHIVFFTKVHDFTQNCARFTYLNKPIKRSELFDAIADLGGFARINIEADKAIPKLSFNAQHILLVEDNLVNQEVAKELLSSVNLNVTIANNGQEACALLKKQDFELVLMDIQMPIMDGISATQEIRSWQGKYQDLPIFAMTAHNLKGDSEKSISAGMNKHITKPIVPKILFEALSAYLMYSDAVLVSSTEGVLESNEPNEQLNRDSEIENLPGLELVDALERVAGNKSILIKLLGLFQQQQQNFVDEFADSIEQGDMETTIRLAHTLKGSAANSGAMTLSSIASDLERHLKELDKSGNIASLTCIDIHQFLQAIHTELEQVFSSIELLITQAKPTNADKQQTDFNIEQAKTLLKQIQDNLYSDLSVVDDNIQLLSQNAYNTHYQKPIASLESAFNAFDYDNILKHTKALLTQLQKTL